MKIAKILFTVVAGLLLIMIMTFAFRQIQANDEIEQEWGLTPTYTPDLQTTSRLEILPLFDEDRAGDNFLFGHGVSYLVRTDSSTVLLDMGNSQNDSGNLPFFQNLQLLNLHWDEIDAILISHPHPDHVGGSQAWQAGTISLTGISRDIGEIPIYAPIAMNVPGKNIIQSSLPTLVATNVATTGVISYPEVFPLSLFNPKGYEQALIVNISGKGLVLITGCGHPTLERLVSRAEKLYGQPVVGIVGGLHYEGVSTEEVRMHIQFLASRQPQLVALSPHDSSPEAIGAFQTAFPSAYQHIRVGTPVQFP